MNICIFGNQDNSGYRFCKWLRNDGHNAQLYLMQHWESARSNPESIDQHLHLSGYPEWIHTFDNTLFRTIFGDTKFFRALEHTYDVAVVIGSPAMMNAFHLSRIPIVNISTGPSNQGVIKMWDHVSLKHRLFWTLVRYFVRKSVKKCTKILVHYDPEIYSLSKLNSLSKIAFYGMPEDITGNAGRVDNLLLNDLNHRYNRFSRVFLWLGRIAFVDTRNPMYKGTDKFIRAAARIVGENHSVRFVIGKHGEDYQQLLNLINVTGLSPYIDWVDHLPYWQLLTYLSISNGVVVDELTSLHCVSSGMFRETLSVNGILIRSYSPILTRAGYGAAECPVLHAESTEELYMRMKEVLSWDGVTDRQWRAKVRQWSGRNLDARKQIKRLTNILEEVVYSHQTATRLCALRDQHGQ